MDNARFAKQMPNLIEVRCSECKKLLAKMPANTEYQIKCPRCGTMNEKEKDNG